MVITKVRRAAKVITEDPAEEEAVEAVEAVETAGEESEESQETHYDDPWEPLVEPQPPAPPPLPHTTFVVADNARTPATPRELFDALPALPGLRMEVLEGRLIVSPVGTPEHGWYAMALSFALYPLMNDKGWKAWAGNVGVCIDGPREPVEPDYVLAPADCPRWGTRELRSSGLIMVAEVVSAGSVPQDLEDKPRIYASGGVPIYLLIDTITTPSVTVLSDIRDGAYQRLEKVPIGTPIRLPEPIGIELETSIFK
ncbi:Uma2 family endonuclease [Spongiactinospora sp. 9N601]|uniref:Uma2 family endonuclease n=1 Tax=Spongiactinospora sp. 9N601 TaxID=3375149 RepID=UPI0037A8FFCC